MINNNNVVAEQLSNKLKIKSSRALLQIQPVILCRFISTTDHWTLNSVSTEFNVQYQPELLSRRLAKHVVTVICVCRNRQRCHFSTKWVPEQRVQFNCKWRSRDAEIKRRVRRSRTIRAETPQISSQTCQSSTASASMTYDFYHRSNTHSGAESAISAQTEQLLGQKHTQHKKSTVSIYKRAQWQDCVKGNP